MFVSEIETPRNDAGTGLLMLGDGKGGFDVKTNSESGFFARGDAKKLISVRVGQKSSIMVGNNDDVLQIFSIN